MHNMVYLDTHIYIYLKDTLNSHVCDSENDSYISLGYDESELTYEQHIV